MQWSALKTRVKSFIASDVRKRIDFHVTSYRRSHDEAEKAWLTIDGKIVFVASWYRHQWAGALYTSKGTMARDGRNYPMHDPDLPDIEEPEELERHRPQQFGDALRRYLNLKLREAITDPDPFIRGLSLVDRRMDLARFARLKPKTNEHGFVKAMYQLRQDCDLNRPRTRNRKTK
jgi:hypothetical protein